MIGRFFTSCRFLYRHRYLAKKLHDFLDAREIMADGRDFQQTMSDILKNKHMEEVLGVISLLWPEKLLDFTEKYERAFRENTRPHCNTIIVCLNRLNNGGIERQISLVTPLWIKMGYKVIVTTIETPTPNDYPLPEDCVRTVLPNDIGRYYGCLHELVCEYRADTIFHHVLTGPHFLVAALVATDLKLNLLGEYHTSYTYFLDTLSPEWSRVHRRLGYVTVA